MNVMMIVSGVLRNTLTYAVPAQRRLGTGEIRMSASAVPSTSERIAAQNVSWMLTQNAPSTSYSRASAQVCDR
ncbi:MAG: hypothetical protein K0S43_843 [Cellulosimicrobium sp.]|nr:hypothetical protein [Cellulosimicrobium sp.]